MNNDLQASYQIISLFEKSKLLSDQILDQTGGIFLNIDGDGKILRANREAAVFLGVPHEDALGLPISALFSSEAYAVFTENIQTANSLLGHTIQFQLPVLFAGGSKDFLWQINQNRITVGPHSFQIYTCMGRDISEILIAHARIVSLAKNLEVVETVQALLLPSSKEIKTAEVSLAASYSPAEISSGDYWWYEFISPTKMWVFLGDVTGHGAGSAMVTAVISGAIKTLWNLSLGGGLALDLPTLLNELDSNLASLRGQPYWMTAVALELNFATDTVHWWSAAGPAFFHIKVGAPVVAVGGNLSSPLGGGKEPSTGQFKFVPGDRLVLITDGIVETTNSLGRYFGERRFRALLADSKTQSSGSALCRELDAGVRNWRGRAPQADDMTSLVIDRLSRE